MQRREKGIPSAVVVRLVAIRGDLAGQAKVLRFLTLAVHDVFRVSKSMDHCSLYEVPDAKWERDLSGGMSASQLDQDEDALPTKCARLENDDTEQQEQSLVSTLDWLNDAFDGEHSFSW
jgi:hypothetical protein